MEENNTPTVEQLQRLVMELTTKNRELSVMNNGLKAQIMNFNNVAASLNYLFKVLECKESFPADFVTGCTNEIMSIMNLDNKEPEMADVIEE